MVCGVSSSGWVSLPSEGTSTWKSSGRWPWMITVSGGGAGGCWPATCAGSGSIAWPASAGNATTIPNAEPARNLLMRLATGRQ
jgi:hypothetical protein